jgi:hypothetical protein
MYWQKRRHETQFTSFPPKVFQRALISGIVVSTSASQPSDRRFESGRLLVHRPVLTGKVGWTKNLPADARVR